MLALFNYFLHESGYLGYWPALALIFVLVTAIAYACRRCAQRGKHYYAEWRRSSLAIAGMWGLMVSVVCFFTGYATQHHWRPGIPLTQEVKDLDEAAKEAGFKTVHQYNGWAVMLPAEVFSEKFLGQFTRGSKPVAVALHLDKHREEGDVIWMDLVDTLGEHIPHPLMRLPAAEARPIEMVDRYYYRDRNPNLTFRGEKANELLRDITTKVKEGNLAGHLEAMDADLKRGERFQRARHRFWSDSSSESTKKKAKEDMDKIYEELRKEGKLLLAKK